MGLVSFDSVPSDAVASNVFIEQKFKKSGKTTSFIPQRIALMAQYLAAKTPVNNLPISVTNADEVANIAGYGSMAHLMAVKLFDNMGSTPAAVDYFPIADGTTAATGTVTFASNASSAGQWTVYIAGKAVTIAVASGDTPTVQAAALVAAITADLTLPVTAAPVAGVVTLTSKWKGASANQIDVRKNYTGLEQALQPGTSTMVIVAMASGAVDPVLTTALANLGTTFYTMILSGLNDAVAAAAFESTFNTRVDPGVKKPVFGVMGYVDTRANFLTALGSIASPTRNSPGSVYVPVEASPMHPGQIAAAVVGQAARSANTNPARPFKTLPLIGILPGTGTPWTWAQQDAVEKAGGSVTEMVGGQVVIKDLLTTYKVNSGGAADDSWRYVCTVTNIQNKEYGINTLFNSDPFTRAVIVDDASTTSLEYALSPKKIKAYVIQLVDTWIEQAWSKNRQTIVDNIVVEIDSINPGRVNILIPDIITVGLRIVAVKYTWAFSAAA